MGVIHWLAMAIVQWWEQNRRENINVASQGNDFLSITCWSPIVPCWDSLLCCADIAVAFWLQGWKQTNLIFPCVCTLVHHICHLSYPVTHHTYPLSYFSQWNMSQWSACQWICPMIGMPYTHNGSLVTEWKPRVGLRKWWSQMVIVSTTSPSLWWITTINNT